MQRDAPPRPTLQCIPTPLARADHQRQARTASPRRTRDVRTPRRQTDRRYTIHVTLEHFDTSDRWQRFAAVSSAIHEPVVSAGNRTWYWENDLSTHDYQQTLHPTALIHYRIWE